MLDIGWTEILVIAIVLIVVVGPKDLPPMLRAFGKMTQRLRSMAGEFRQQFDEALKEAELDDVRKTIADAQRLNPVNSLKDALNPLRQMGNEIRSDLQKATKVETPTIAEPWTPPEPAVTLQDEPPVFPKDQPSPAAEAPVSETPASRDVPKPARKPRAAKQASEPVPAAEPAKPKRAPRAKATTETATATGADAPVTAQKSPARKTAKPAASEVAATAPAKSKKPAAKAKKTGEA